MILKKALFTLILIGCYLANIYAFKPAGKEESMVKKFYSIQNENLYWLSSNERKDRAIEWLSYIASPETPGNDSVKLQSVFLLTSLQDNNIIDSLKMKTDQQITGLVLSYLKEIQEGAVLFDYDEVSISRTPVYVNQLLTANPREPVSEILSRFKCKDHDYQVLEKYLNDSITQNDSLKYKKVILAMNYRKYLAANQPSEYIVVNIPAAEAKYYRNDSLKIKMRVVVGQKTKPTPVISSYITSIVTFPRWNVPYYIGVKELLPKIQKDENYLEQNGFEVVDSNGSVVDDQKLNWAAYNEKNFPYFFRQSTGPGNTLGMMKFDLQNPFSIFLHATSQPETFARATRFLSHGCARLQKPFELANALLRGTLNIQELKKGKKNTESKTIKLPQKVATFIIYLPVKVEGNRVTFLKDPYDLIK